jgi:RNA-directed DNA polymerase
MKTERQKNQYRQLALPMEITGEAHKAVGRGTEVFMAEQDSERLVGNGEQLMEGICEPANVGEALKRVVANKGSAGIDGMTVKELPATLEKEWPNLRVQLLRGTYRPQPVKRVEIPKPEGGVRELGIPTVLDRFVQQAALQVLQKIWDPTFSGQSYGFRPGRSAHQAIRKAQEYIAGGNRVVVDIDLEKFFDRVNHDKLMARLTKRIEDKRCLKLIRAFLNAGIMENGLVSQRDEGTPQGGPLSPLLSNIVLDELDRELERRGHLFIRYADDCNIYVRSRHAGRRVMESITHFITKRLKLKVNDQKSAVGAPSTRKFLGFSFTTGEMPRRRVAKSAVKRFVRRVRELTGRTGGVSLQAMVERLSKYMKGWMEYFGICETPTPLHALDSWVHRRLRSVAWKQWKRGRTRYSELRKRGCKHWPAAAAAGSCKGPWRISYGASLNTALPGAYFYKLGLPSLEASMRA